MQGFFLCIDIDIDIDAGFLSNERLKNEEDDENELQ
jgi:hypothetical protein